mmetsp:Transcript_6153/g.24808  ORF Transcript_6153/g.24808 Transcript_6153/m.24808 type:complete len:326 (+) Transcript_6153:478-1455(+)
MQLAAGREGGLVVQQRRLEVGQRGQHGGQLGVARGQQRVRAGGRLQVGVERLLQQAQGVRQLAGLLQHVRNVRLDGRRLRRGAAVQLLLQAQGSAQALEGARGLALAAPHEAQVAVVLRDQRVRGPVHALVHGQRLLEPRDGGAAAAQLHVGHREVVVLRRQLWRAVALRGQHGRACALVEGNCAAEVAQLVPQHARPRQQRRVGRRLLQGARERLARGRVVAHAEVRLRLHRCAAAAQLCRAQGGVRLGVGARRQPCGHGGGQRQRRAVHRRHRLQVLRRQRIAVRRRLLLLGALFVAVARLLLLRRLLLLLLVSLLLLLLLLR